jgi:hypothetical protein
MHSLNTSNEFVNSFSVSLVAFTISHVTTYESLMVSSNSFVMTNDSLNDRDPASTHRKAP